MGQKLFSNRQILFRLHGFTPILVWPQALYSLICYVDGTRAAEDLFNERENKIMFVLALKRRANLWNIHKKKKKMTVGRNYVSLSSPSPCWLYFKRLTVVRLSVKGGGVLCTRGNARLLIITGYPPSHREGWYTFARACVRVLKYSISCQWRKRTRIKIDLHMKYQPLRKFRKGSWSSH